MIIVIIVTDCRVLLSDVDGQRDDTGTCPQHAGDLPASRATDLGSASGRHRY